MKTKLLLAAVLGLFLVTLGLAQEPSTVLRPPTSDPAASSANRPLSTDTAALPDIAAVKGPGGIPVAALVSLLATVVTAAVKLGFDKLGAKLNPAYIPFVAMGSGYLLDLLSHKTFGTDTNWALALMAGLTAVGLNQVKKQFTPDPKAVG